MCGTTKWTVSAWSERNRRCSPSSKQATSFWSMNSRHTQHTLPSLSPALAACIFPFLVLPLLTLPAPPPILFLAHVFLFFFAIMESPFSTWLTFSPAKARQEGKRSQMPVCSLTLCVPLRMRSSIPSGGSPNLGGRALYLYWDMLAGDLVPDSKGKKLGG